MNIIANILQKIYVVIIKYNDSYDYEKVIFRGNSSEIQEYNECLKKDAPVFVIVCGYGVIAKDITTNDDILNKIKSSNDFLWEEDDAQTLSFVRRVQLEPMQKELESMRVLDIRLLAGEVPDCDVIKSYVNKLYEIFFSLKYMLTPSLYGSQLCICVFNKLKFWILFFVLIVLSSNHIIDHRVQAKIKEQNIELNAIRQINGESDKIKRERQKMMSVYMKSIPYRYSYLCDRIAHKVHGKIQLSKINIQPLLKSIEANTAPQILDNTIIIEGESPDSESISKYINDLKLERFAKVLTLKYLRRDVERNVFVFNINIGI